MMEESTDFVPRDEENIEKEPFQSGFSFRIILAALFIGFIMLPGSIYLTLMMGTPLAGAAQWVTIILFIEVAKRSFITLKKQEIYMMFIMASFLLMPGAVMGAVDLTIAGGIFGKAIWDQYFIQSPFAHAFGLTDLIPRWIVPPVDSPALAERTFLHSEWVIPFLVLGINQVLFMVNRFTLGYGLFRVTSDIEKLEFPIARVASEGAMALAESSSRQEGWRWRIFSIGAMIGVIYGFFYIVIPTVTGLFMPQPLTLIPIPFVDFTSQIGTFLPASVLGFMTDLSPLMAGFILPFWVVIGIFAGSIGTRVILNPILHNMGVIQNWRPGMSMIPTMITTDLDVWLSIVIGFGIMVGLIGVFTVMFTLKRRNKRAGKAEGLPKGRGDYPIWLAFLIWGASTLLYIILVRILVPAFPVWITAVFGFLVTPFLSYISARMFGITGSLTGIQFPMLREGAFILSGYRGADIWFAPVPFFNHGMLAQEFKQAELTRTSFTSWYKAAAVSFLIMAVCSFIFWQLIWKMGDIPSSTYPFVHRMWPLFSIQRALWASSLLEDGETWMLQAIRPSYILIGTGTAGILYFLLSIFKAPVALFYGMVGGISMWPHRAIPLFAGALLGKYFLGRRIGAKTWRAYAPILLAGYGCGVGLVGTVGIAVALIAQSVIAMAF